MFPCTVKDPEGMTKQIILCELCLVRSATDDSENQNAHSERATCGTGWDVFNETANTQYNYNQVQWKAFWMLKTSS